MAPVNTISTRKSLLNSGLPVIYMSYYRLICEVLQIHMSDKRTPNFLSIYITIPVLFRIFSES
jgi:hypothetical protein